MALLLTDPASGGPAVTVTAPEDGSWTTSPEVLVEGTAQPGPPVDESVPVAGLGQGTGHFAVREGGKLVLRPVCTFSDGFDGTDLNTSVWKFTDALGTYMLHDGALVLMDDAYEQLPLVTSSKLALPLTDWTASFRMSGQGIVDAADAGGGLTAQMTNAYNGYVSAMFTRNETYGRSVYIWSAGKSLKVVPCDMGWHEFRIEATRGASEYKLTMDGLHETYVPSFVGDCLWWFGRGYHWDSPWYYPSIWLDYVDIWTFKGDWTFPPHDIGARVLLERTAPIWTSTNASDSLVGLEVRTSLDAVEWSDWAKPAGGAIDPPVECQYVQFRLALSMDGVKDESAALNVTGFDLRYTAPVLCVQVKAPGGEWVNATGTGTWSAPVTLQEDGNVLEARAVDTLLANGTATINVTLDTTPPVGTVAIKGPRPYTNDANVTLLLDAHDAYGVVSVGISHYPDFYEERVIPYVNETAWRLQGGLGDNTVFVRFYDAHGLASAAACATVRFDPFPPSGHVVVAGGAAYTTTGVVGLVLDYADETGLLSVELSNDPGMADARAVPLGTRAVEAWALAGEGDGPRTVYMRMRDLAGNEAVVSDGIEVYVPKALGRVTLAGGAAVTNLTVVTVRVEPPPELAAESMQLSQDPGFAGALWEGVVGEKLFILAPGDGIARVYARFLDFRGIASLPVNDTIVLDTTPPSVVVAIDGGARFTTDTTVSVTVGYEDPSPAGRMWRCSDGRFDLAAPVPFEGLFDWTVPAAEGDWRVHVMVEDAAGNRAVAVAAIRFATKTPTISLSFTSGRASNATRALPVTVVWMDPYGGVEVQLALDSDPPAGAAWRPADGISWVDLPQGVEDGNHEVRARARNAAGLVSAVTAWQLVLDRGAPRITILEPEDGATLRQGGLAIRMRLAVDDLTVPTAASFRLDLGEWQPLDDLRNLTGRATVKGFGTHTIEFRVTDSAGNTGEGAASFELVRPRQGLPSGWALAMMTTLVAVAAVIAAVAWLGKRRGGSPPKG